MTHAIRTVAAQMEEKNVDPELIAPVMAAGINLFRELTHAEVKSEVYDHFPGKRTLPTVKVKLARIAELPVNTMGKILENLGCNVELKNQQLWVTPPSFRPDIEIPADVIEEIARIYGYHNLPSVIMPTAIPLDKPTNTNFAIYLHNVVGQFELACVRSNLALSEPEGSGPRP